MNTSVEPSFACWIFQRLWMFFFSLFFLEFPAEIQSKLHTLRGPSKDGRGYETHTNQWSHFGSQWPQAITRGGTRGDLGCNVAARTCNGVIMSVAD